MSNAKTTKAGTLAKAAKTEAKASSVRTPEAPSEQVLEPKKGVIYKFITSGDTFLGKFDSLDPDSVTRYYVEDGIQHQAAVPSFDRKDFTIWTTIKADFLAYNMAISASDAPKELK